jgi:hypothetical protein
MIGQNDGECERVVYCELAYPVYNNRTGEFNNYCFFCDVFMLHVTGQLQMQLAQCTVSVIGYTTIYNILKH